MEKIELTRDEFRLILLAYQARNKDILSTENYINMVFDDRNKLISDSYQPERSKREDLCFCEYCEEEKSKYKILGFICKQCMEEM